MGESRTWTEREVRDLIAVEVSTGQTMVALNAAIASGELTSAVSQIVATTQSGFDAQTSRVSSIAADMEATKATIDTEMTATKATIEKILLDCRTFVSETTSQADAQKAAMTLQVDALHTKMQDIVKFVDGMPDTLTSLKDRLEVVTSWLSANKLESLPGNLQLLQTNHDELEANTDRRLRELTAEISAAQSSGYTGFLGGTHSTPQATKDRNVFDPRDYKLAELGPKPTLARWKKWRRDFEGFVDTIGFSWKGTSGLLRELRHREAPFTAAQLSEAVANAKKRHDKTPDEAFYAFEEKADTLYRLIMPKLDEVLSNELAQTGKENDSSCFASSRARSTRPAPTLPSTSRQRSRAWGSTLAPTSPRR